MIDLNTELPAYQKVQAIAKAVLNEMCHYIKSGISERDIANRCTELMQSRGVEKFWYHNVPAFVLVGERTTVSLSGRQYQPSGLQVSDHDLVTIDLSPEINGFWGDCARSFVIIDGQCCIHNIPDPALSEGIALEQSLHQALIAFATPDKTFDQLHAHFNAMIADQGYFNLDFHGNLGHSIEKNIGNRQYIEKGCHTQLVEVPCFTFEPHIRKHNDAWGFKHENIYYFADSVLREL